MTAFRVVERPVGGVGRRMTDPHLHAAVLETAHSGKAVHLTLTATPKATMRTRLYKAATRHGCRCHIKAVDAHTLIVWVEPK